MVKAELPKMSDNVAEHESEIVKLKEEVADIKSARDEEMENEEDAGKLQIKNEVQNLIIKCQKSRPKNFCE